MSFPWSRSARPLPATYWWLFAGMLVSALATFVFPFLALFLRSRGFSTQEAGLVVSAFGAGTVVSAPLAGLLADRVGRRPTLLFGLCATATTAAALPFLPAPGLLTAGVALFGLFSNAFRPAASATVADVVAPEDRARAFGMLYWANNLGLAASMIVGGGLAAFGFGPLFLADAATTLLFAVLVWRQVPETRPQAGSGGAGAAGGYGDALRDRVLLVFLGLHVAFVVVLFQFLAAASMDMVSRGLTPGQYGRVLAVNGVLIAFLQPITTRLSSARDSSRVLAIAAVLVGAGYGAFALCATAWQYAFATAVWSLGEILALPTSAAMVAGMAPAHLRGRYQGLYSFSFGVAMFLAPALGSAALQRLGSRVLWSGCLGVTLLVAAGQLAAGPGRRRRLAA